MAGVDPADWPSLVVAGIGESPIDTARLLLGDAAATRALRSCWAALSTGEVALAKEYKNRLLEHWERLSVGGHHTS